MKPLRLGRFTVRRMVEAEPVRLDPRSLFPDSAAERIERAATFLDDRSFDRAAGSLIVAQFGYLIETGRRTVLVDTGMAGLGDEIAEKVDVVVNTHIHGDRVGGNIARRQGRIRPRFARARYIVARSEFEYHERRFLAGEDVPAYFLDSVRPLRDMGLLDLVRSDHIVDEGIELEPAPGHTAGQVIVRLRSGGAEGILSADIVHHPIQVHDPRLAVPAEFDGAMALAARLGLLSRAVDRDIVVLPAHFAAPTAGRVVSRGDGFGFVWHDQ